MGRATRVDPNWPFEGTEVGTSCSNRIMGLCVNLVVANRMIKNRSACLQLLLVIPQIGVLQGVCLAFKLAELLYIFLCCWVLAHNSSGPDVAVMR